MISERKHVTTLWGVEVCWWWTGQYRSFAVGIYPWERLVALAFDKLRVNIGPADKEQNP